MRVDIEVGVRAQVSFYRPDLVAAPSVAQTALVFPAQLGWLDGRTGVVAPLAAVAAALGAGLSLRVSAWLFERAELR